MRNAVAFCSCPVIYLQSPDCLDLIQISMGYVLIKYLEIDAWISPWNWSPVSRGCCNHLPAKRKMEIHYQSAFAWKVLDSKVSPWTKFHFLSSSNHSDNSGHCYRSLGLSCCSLYCRGIWSYKGHCLTIGFASQSSFQSRSKVVSIQGENP